MAQVIGKVNELDGSFFVRNAEGKISVLNEGDTLYDGDVILGSGSNSNSNFAKVLLADNSKTINVFGDSQQLFDETMLTSELSSETVVLDDELNESLLLEASGETLVPEDGQEQATLTLEEIENLSEAAAGDETAENTEVLTARLENRTGGEVDVNTDLRDSSTFGGGLLVDDPEAEVIEDELANPSISIAATKSTAYESSFFLSRQIESEEELDNLEFTVSQDVVSTLDVLVNINLNLGEAEVEDFAFIEYTNSAGTLVTLSSQVDIQNFVDNGATISIPAGSTTAPLISLFVKNDIIYEISEELSMTISSPVNGILGVTEAFGTIFDDTDGNESDKPIVSIEATTDTAKEGETTGVVFTVSQTNESNFDTEVDFTVTMNELELADIASISYTDSTGTTAVTDIADFIANGVILKIGANTTDTPTVTIVPVDDDIHEVMENFAGNIALSAGETDAILGTSTDTAKFVDEGDTNEGDKPTVSIEATTDTAKEGETTGVVFTVSQTNESNFDTEVDFTVTMNELELADIASISYTDSTGTTAVTDIADFIANGVILKIGANTTDTPTVTIVPVDDDIHEVMENFAGNIALSAGETDAILGTSTDTAKFVDEGDTNEGDKPTVSIEATTDTAKEGETTGVVFTVSQTNESNFDTEVDFTVTMNELELADIASISYTDSTGTTAVTDIADFIANGVTLKIGANTTDTPTVTIVPVDDDIHEIMENFAGNIALSAGETDAILGISTDTAKFVDEGDTNEGDKPTVSIEATIDTATEGEYLNSEKELYMNDSYFEQELYDQEESYGELESVLFTISQDNESNFDTSVDFTLGDLEIEAADILSITYTDSTGSTTLTNPTDISDFVLNGVTLTIGANTTDTPTVRLTPVDDDIYEREETFTGNIALSAGETDVMLGVSTDEARFIDEEDKEGDKPTVKIVATDDLAVEGVANDTIVFEISQDNVSNFETKVVAKLDLDEVELADIDSITYTDAGGTATVLSAGQITSLTDGTGLEVLIPVGSSGKPSFTITAVDDDIYEQSEEFGMNISGAVNADLGVSSDTAAIEDEEDKEGDKPTVKIVATDDLAVEGVANDTIVFEISQDNVSNFETKVVAKLDLDEVELADIDSITYTDAGGTATVLSAGQITSLTDGTGLEVLIPVGSSGKPSFTIAVYDDNVSENAESLAMNISGVMNATLGVSSDTAIIIDDEAKPSLTINDRTVDEDAGTMTFTVTLSGEADADVTFTYATSDGTAIAGSDYTAVGGTGTITAGTTTTTIEVPILDDNVYENTESFNMNLSAPSVNATIADGLGVGTITDDEAKPSLTINDRTVDEDAGTMTFTVTLSGEADADVTFTYATSDGTAIAGSDYTAVGGTGTITAGTTTTTIEVPILDDNVYENTESFNMNLSAPSVNATIADGLGVGTITDDEAKPSLTINDRTVDEDAGTMTFTVTLSGEADADVTFTYATSDGTAIAGSDYTAVGGTGTITAGTTTTTIEVPILDDNVYENTESFNMNLSAPSVNATIADGLGVGTITDDQTIPVVSIIASDDLAIEGSVGNTTLEFTVSQDKLSEFDTTVDLDLTLGTVEVEDIDTITYTDSSGTIVVLNSTSEINDFVSNGDTLKIEANSLSAPSIVITVAQDNIYEASEVLTMEISNPSNAILGTNSDTGTIQDINTLPTSVDEEQTLTFDFNGSATTNIVLILDTSGSMGNSAGNGQTRLSLAKDALENLITAYDNIGDVNVQLVEFAGSATSINFTSGDAAIAAINALTDGGSTNYEEAIESAIDNTTFTPSTDPSVNTLGFFITDGEPTSESDDPDSDLLSPSFVSDWDDFINTTLQVDQLNVIGVGTGISLTYLNELKVTSDPVVIVTDPNDLDATLQDTIVDGSVSGNALDNIDFNYNGAGQIDSIIIDGTTYNNSSPTELEETTAEGATFKFNFDTGAYTYEANSSNFMADVSEVITVNASDANGDITTFDITINVDVDVIASPAILDVSLGNETLIPVAGSVIDVTNNFNSNLEGWTGDISRSSNEMEIESGNNSEAIKTFYFDTAYVGQPLTISFDTDIDTNGGSKWDSGTDEFVVEINGTEVYSEKDSSDLNEETHTLTNVFLKPDGSLDVKFIVHSGGNSEWVEIDDFNIVGTFAPITNIYQYDMTINAGLLDNDGSEVLSDKVILDNLPSGITLKDSNDVEIVANGDGTYSVEVDANGDATATLISDTQLANGDIDDITASIDTTELHGNDTETVTVNVKAEIDGTASAETINGTAADELIDGKAGADTIDAGLGDDTLVFDPNDLKLDGGSNSSTDNDTLLLEGNDGIDFSTLDNSALKNIDTLNLRDGDHTLEKLSLQDVIDMTDSADKTLRITGDSSDNVELKDGTGAWTSTSTQEIDTVTYDVYTNSEDSSYKVLVQQEIADTVVI
ncbi:Calx-beta domain-containing protein [Poseidonibacter lekithochrous]|uniref:Calx-beta domain-containing protein n=1 Tax=Poseidonibacter lekithochrous TaxID=1904463 RepID=UPI0008FC4C8C|nr:Calx-beta domain-containing protein [Poseidonibacter lekithochrous]